MKLGVPDAMNRHESRLLQVAQLATIAMKAPDQEMRVGTSVPHRVVKSVRPEVEIVGPRPEVKRWMRFVVPQDATLPTD